MEYKWSIISPDATAAAQGDAILYKTVFKRRQIWVLQTLSIACLFVDCIIGVGMCFSRPVHRLQAVVAPYNAGAMTLHTRGRELLYANGKVAVLHGVTMAAKPGTPNWTHIQQSLAVAIQTWHSQLIGLPLSQDAWFGKLPNSQHGGASYRHTIDALVRYCADHHVYIDLTLRWTDMGRWGKYMGRHRMPDGNSESFWRAAARRYKHYPNVLLGLFASPYGVDWHTWLYGGVCTEETASHVIAYRAVGMQELYNTVRAAGAENVVVVPGCRHGYDLFGVIHGFVVQGKNIMYETHIFPWMKHWRKAFELAAAHVPVLVGGWGGGKHDLAFATRLLAVMHEEQLSWTAVYFGQGPPWPVLIRNWQYQPTTFGNMVKKQLIATDRGSVK